MWVLTTRNRPDLCREMLDACVATETSTPGIVWMDGCDYGTLRMPDRWLAIADHEHRNIGAILRHVFAQYPDLPWYGWLADDCRPLSNGWDVELIKQAGDWGIAYPDDGWQRGKKADGSPHVTSMVCIGGKLLRAMGFWVLEQHVQMYIDDSWEAVAVPLGLMRYCPHVISEHRHVYNNKRPQDATDTRLFKGQSFPHNDRLVLEMWKSSYAYEDTVKRVRDAMAFDQGGVPCLAKQTA